MKNTDKITLTVGQIKRLIKESSEEYVTLSELINYLQSLDPNMVVCNHEGYPVRKEHFLSIVFEDSDANEITLG